MGEEAMAHLTKAIWVSEATGLRAPEIERGETGRSPTINQSIDGRSPVRHSAPGGGPRWGHQSPELEEKGCFHGNGL